MSQLKEVVDRLIDTGTTGVMRRRLFNLDAAAYLELEDLPLEKRGKLFQMTRDVITQYINAKEDPDWNNIDVNTGWQWSGYEWPRKDPDPACHCEPAAVEVEYPEPTPQLYTLTPVAVKANTPTKVEIIGRGFVMDATTVSFMPAAGPTVEAPLLGPVRGTFRCSRVDVLVNLPTPGTWTAQVAIQDPASDGFLIQGNLSLSVE